jgi:glucosamine--fructose-6-phosphate aminotransferase (isomerizing)
LTIHGEEDVLLGEEWNVNQAPAKTKPKFPHHMIREIYEQPDAVRRVLNDHIDDYGTIRLPELPFTSDQIRSFSKITIAASGSSRHAGMVGEFMLERMAAIDVEVDFASQYCYRDPVVAPKELTVFLSQSGTTIDTITALQVARRKHARSLAICNVPETPLTQLADATFLTHAGEEVAIAATKSFTTQLTALFLLAAYFAQERGTLNGPARMALDELQNLPARMEEALETDERSREYAKQVYRFKDFIFIGRDIDYPIALEGALKLKEVSYIHAEGYPTGELKHGPTALVNEQLPIVVLAAHDSRDPDSTLRYRRSVSNIREFIEREIPVLSIVPNSDSEIEKIAPCVLRVPDIPLLLQPILEVIPLQLLAYHIAVLCGRDVDRPRHLSKSVVVE